MGHPVYVSNEKCLEKLYCVEHLCTICITFNW